MKSLLRYGILSISLTNLASVSSHAEDWPQFLGPNRDAVSVASVGDWSKQEPTAKWTIPIGPGFGGAAVVGGTVYFLDRREGEADIFRALNLADGLEQWKVEYPAPGRLSHNGSRSVPTIVGDRAWTVGGFGHLTCYDLKAHSQVWQVSLDKEFATAKLNWGYAQSPLVIDGQVVVAPPHPDSPRLAALDAATGKLLWKTENGGGDYYTSPILRTICGVTGILQLSNDMLSFHDPKTGKELWQWKGWVCKWSIPAPTVLSDGKRIMVTGGYDAGSVMLKCALTDGKWQIQEAFRLKEGCQLHPFIEYKGHLYGNINENTTLKKNMYERGGLACVDPDSGKVLWRSGDKPNFGRGAVVLAKDQLVIMDGDIGSVTTVAPEPSGYKQVGTIAGFARKPGDNKIWAPIALADGYMVIRDQEQMRAYRLPGN